MKDFALGVIFFSAARTVLVTLGGKNDSFFSGTCSRCEEVFFHTFQDFYIFLIFLVRVVIVVPVVTAVHTVAVVVVFLLFM